VTFQMISGAPEYAQRKAAGCPLKGCLQNLRSIESRCA